MNHDASIKNRIISFLAVLFCIVGLSIGLYFIFTPSKDEQSFQKAHPLYNQSELENIKLIPAINYAESLFLKLPEKKYNEYRIEALDELFSTHPILLNSDEVVKKLNTNLNANIMKSLFFIEDAIDHLEDPLPILDFLVHKSTWDINHKASDGTTVFAKILSQRFDLVLNPDVDQAPYESNWEKSSDRTRSIEYQDALIQWALEHKGDIQWVNQNGNTFLHLLLNQTTAPVIEENNKITAVKDFDKIAKGQKFDLHDLLPSPFHIDPNDAVHLEWFIDHGVDVLARNHEGNTALHASNNAPLSLAIVQSNPLIVSALNNQEQNLFHTVTNPLVLIEILQYLSSNPQHIDHSIDQLLNTRDASGKPPVLSLIEQTDDQKNNFALVVVEATPENPDLPLRERIKIESLDDMKIQILDAFIQFGADIQYQDEKRNTFIHMASRFGETNVVKYLIGKNLNPHQVNLDGDSPMHIAAQNGFSETIIALLNAHSHVNQFNHAGHSPLYLAVAQDQLSAIQTLVSNGADPTLTQKGVMSPFELAKEKGDQSIIDALQPKENTKNR